ncbi:MAG: DNA repair protein RecN [Clostridia bacterium]|nr:DNA repair protein RecN [Clostridia bacterium]MBQ2110891.1 DNA repair protein RecN [Clostridia bacterium]MBQ3938647.1 DNA repair protein RecN [Clostridia bacterium]MBQ5488225.1 DNA repair protein RecN [Clostridia bacterium]MBR4636959.1 DNA repair protein RecN [Clostridia bacterium]
MLSRLIINNIALIEHLDIELSEGLNVLTGETGAGKSIIIDSVNLVLGDRGSKDLISYGKQKARVEAFFDIAPGEAASELFAQLEQLGIEADNSELMIVRELTASGKSLCRVNGELVTLAALRAITDSLVDVHGQHEHQSLLEPKKHIGILDAFRAKEIEPARKEVAALCDSFREVESKLNSGFVSAEERERRLDILSYQIREIDKAAVVDGEEEAIEEELRLLSNAEKINSALENGGSLLSGDNGVLDKLRSAVSELSDISDISEQYGELHSRLDNAYYELEDAAYQLRELRYGFEYSPERLNELEHRLDQLTSLKRKYGGSLKAVLEFRDKAAQELEELTGADELRAKLAKERSDIIKKYRTAAGKLTELRKAAADELRIGVNRELHELGMEKAVFDVAFRETEDGVHKNGADDVEFMLSANAGEPLKPLSKVASGGELSRIMLAIKTVCAGSDGTPTLIFDEVDTGISGRTAVKVGERMSIVSRAKQVLSVTHLPQIAAFADNHLLVEKRVDGDRTVTELRLLSEDERKYELARIMGAAGPAESAAAYAAELIAEADKFKNTIHAE